jgi:hypothetical protein
MRNQSTSPGPRRKKISEQDIIGQLGINLIESIVLRMGYVWHPTKLEAGIDGYIEIRDGRTGEVTNNIIQVQSKATRNPFANETGSSFTFTCDERDLYYWLGGNAPVIIIVSNVDRGDAYWVSIKDYFSDPKTLKERKITFYKDRNRFDPDASERVQQLAIPVNRGLYLNPIPRSERLYSNFLLLSEYPSIMYVAETTFRSRRELGGALAELGSPHRLEWVLGSGQILSVHDLREWPWTNICDRGSVETFSMAEWSDSNERERQRDFVQLMRYCLSEKLYRLAVTFQPHWGIHYFRATRDLAPRSWSYRGDQQRTSKRVFQPYFRKSKSGESTDEKVVAYYRHCAFESQFQRFNSKWYLEVNPTYYYTWDGRTEYSGREALLKGMRRLEKNRAVLGHLLMWASVLQAGPNLFAAEDNWLSFSGPVTFDVGVGIDDDAWKEADETNENEDEATDSSDFVEQAGLFDYED